MRILFVCHGNICRSPMAEFYMKDLVQKKGPQEMFSISSAATTSEEIWNGRGNPIYPPAKRVLETHGIVCDGKRARLMARKDYSEFDYLVGMDSENFHDMRRICGGDPQGKISLLRDYVTWEQAGVFSRGEGRDVADPWYTGDFQACWDDIVSGCNAFCSYLSSIDDGVFHPTHL